MTELQALKAALKTAKLLPEELTAPELYPTFMVITTTDGRTMQFRRRKRHVVAVETPKFPLSLRVGPEPVSPENLTGELDRLFEEMMEVSRELNRLATEEKDPRRRETLIRVSKKASQAKREAMSARDTLRDNLN